MTAPPGDGTHRCPGPRCKTRVPYHMLACRPHWYAVPKPLRDAVWHAVRNDGIGSAAHTEAIGAAIEAMGRGR